jgi:hypothetical protein
MIRRALGAAALVALLAACSKGPGHAAPTTLPPTTRVPAPITPTGVVDTVRTWVAAIQQEADAQAWAVLGPRTQALIGARDNYAGVKDELETLYGKFGKVSATYDGLPVADGLAVVVIHNARKNGSSASAAVPMVAVGGTWRAEPFLDTGRYRPVPEDETEIAPLPDLSVVVGPDTSVQVWVDEQPAEVRAAEQTGIDEQEYAYTPATGLRPGWHLVTYVFRKGDAIAARTVQYRVPEPK